MSSIPKQGFHSFKKYNIPGCMLGRDKTCLRASAGEGMKAQAQDVSRKTRMQNAFYLKEAYAFRSFP